MPDGADGDEAEEVRLEILDADGRILRSMSSTTPEKQAPSIWRKLFPEFFDPPLLDVRPGANRWVWDLRLPDAELVSDAVLWGSAVGPIVPPGSYQVRMTVGDWTDTSPFEVVADPRRDLDEAALQARYELAREIWTELSQSHTFVERLDSVRGQIEGWTKRVDDEEIRTFAAGIIDDLDAIESRIRQTALESSQDVLNFPAQLDNQLVYLKGIVEATPGFPAQSSRERLDELRSELKGIEDELNKVLSTEVPKLETLLESAAVPLIDTKK